MEIVHARCCGLDVHKKSVVACVLLSQPDGLIERQVRTFRTMTGDLLELADWLHSLGVTHVALESTGVYWRPVLARRALRPQLPQLRRALNATRQPHHLALLSQ